MDTAPHSILTDQNSTRQLARLAAQRHLYSAAKTVQVVQMVLTIPAPVVWAVIIAALPAVPVLKAWAALYGIVVSILDAAVIERVLKSLKLTAAKIQELFDTEVLQLEWNYFRVNTPPDPETVQDASVGCRRKHPEDIRDWYPRAIAPLPLHLARLVCQRANCRWDSFLRRRYAAFIVVVVCLVTVVVFSLGLAGRMTMEKFLLAVLAPLSPTFHWGIREYWRQRDAADAVDQMKRAVDELWSNAVRETFNEDIEACTRKSRDLQDEIFYRRRDGPLIPDVVYRYLRPRQEDQMDASAEELAEQALRALGTK